jgi:hypothetical protein
VSIHKYLKNFRAIKLLLPQENGVQKEENIVPNEPPKEEKSKEVQIF